VDGREVGVTGDVEVTPSTRGGDLGEDCHLETGEQEPDGIDVSTIAGVDVDRSYPAAHNPA
jgi:hypothetical protein